MKPIAILLILLLSSCSLAPDAAKLPNKEATTINENIHRYGKGLRWHFIVFRHCDSGKKFTVSCKIDRMRFKMFKRDITLI